MTTRNELVVAVADRYARSDRLERSRILDECVAVTGHHRKHAMRLLRGGDRQTDQAEQRRSRVYDAAMREALIVLWEASDRVCGKRLRPSLPVLVEAMERHGHVQLAPGVRIGVLSMSAATIDRMLKDVKEKAGQRRRRRAPPSAAIRRSVPVRTFSDWKDPAPGFVEADLVAHSGPSSRGSYVGCAPAGGVRGRARSPWRSAARGWGHRGRPPPIFGRVRVARPVTEPETDDDR